MERNETIIGAYYITAPLADGGIPAYRSGDCQEEIREISIRQYKKLSPLSVINSRKASLCSVCRETQHTERYRN